MAGKKQKISAKQAEERRQAAIDRAQKAAAKQKRVEMIKRVGVIVVCTILALALAIPTVGLMFLGSGK